MPKKSRDTQKTHALPLNHKKETDTSHLEPFLFKNIVERNRYIFLHTLDQHYKLSGLKAWLWRGTALHLLELVHLISPEMHTAANEYFHISKKILNEKSYFPLSRAGRRLSFNPTPFSQQIPHESSEKEMEEKKKQIKPITEFVGFETEESSLINLARTVCRRAERRVVSFCKKEKIDKNILVYFNRLSDYLFILSLIKN